MSVAAHTPRFVVCEDGAEYIDRFRRFLGDAFAFVPAHDLGDAIAAVAAGQGAGVDGLLFDLDFRRTPPDRLVDERGRALAGRGAHVDDGARRRLTETQGIHILRALRARGVSLPAVLFADLADAEQARFLERTLGPLVVAPSSTGLREIGALLARLVTTAS
jgi:hypothetical protein